MKNIKLKALIIFLIFFSSFKGFSQEAEEDSFVKFNMNADIMSRFIWRGMQLGGTSPCIQPTVSLGLGNFELGVFGSYSIGGENQDQEFDLYASYTFLNDMFSVILTDYYSPNENRDYEYFDFNDETTGHFIEAAVSFNGTDQLPLTFLAAVMLYGADAPNINDNPNSAGFNTQTGIQHSNYFEVGYNMDIANVGFKPFLGITLNNPTDPDNNIGYVGETGFYGTGPGIVNFGFTGVKEIKVTEKFSVPLSLSVITNPQAEKVYFVVGFSF